ncbi:MAG: DMT family transporter [Nitratireductor sp.]|nr:DMT family transporter [Nitratireductor sp.]MCC0021055.1 DMT family transporter [Nitratireductor sp.]
MNFASGNQPANAQDTGLSAIPDGPDPSPGAGEHADNLRGSLFMVVSMAAFSVNDAIIKYAGTELGVGQTLFIRGLFASILVYVAARIMGQWRSPAVLLDRALGLRTIGELVATGCFVTALFNMPLANATAILQALPLAITLAAALLWKEEIGWRRMLAILAGFTGVMIIVRPGLDGFNWYSVMVIVAVVGCVVRDMSTRMVADHVPGMMVAFATAVSVGIMGAVLILFQGWHPVHGGNIIGIAGSSVFLVVGYYFIVLTMRKGNVGVIAPFRYSILIFSIILGLVVFGNFPDFWTLTGSAIVVIAGIYTLYRERHVRKQAINVLPQR